MVAEARERLIEILIAYAAEDYTESQHSLVEAIVDDAIEEVRNARYPFSEPSDTQKEAVLNRYMSNIRRIMEYHYDKIGKEGVTTFYEAGQTTSWEKGGTPDSFFRGILPVAKVL